MTHSNLFNRSRRVTFSNRNLKYHNITAATAGVTPASRAAVKGQDVIFKRVGQAPHIPQPTQDICSAPAGPEHIRAAGMAPMATSTVGSCPQSLLGRGEEALVQGQADAQSRHAGCSSGQGGLLPAARHSALLFATINKGGKKPPN